MTRSLERSFLLFFFFNDTATTEIYTLSLHDALPIFGGRSGTHPTPTSARTVRGRSASSPTVDGSLRSGPGSRGALDGPGRGAPRGGWHSAPRLDPRR